MLKNETGKNKRRIAMFALGFSSGLPLLLILSTLSASGMPAILILLRNKKHFEKV